MTRTRARARRRWWLGLVALGLLGAQIARAQPAAAPPVTVETRALLREELRDAARAKDQAKVEAMMKDFGRQTCGGCHTPFRKPLP